MQSVKPLPARTKSQAPAASQNFEWVAHGDATARRRARAHVTRGFRRKKAEEAPLARSQNQSKSSSPVSVEQDAVVDSVLVTVEPLVQPYKKSVSKVHDGLTLSRLGSGRTDPFATLPLSLDASTHALLDHCNQPLPSTEACLLKPL